jgi:hypothetical protein
MLGIPETIKRQGVSIDGIMAVQHIKPPLRYAAVAIDTTSNHTCNSANCISITAFVDSMDKSVYKG